MAVRDIQVPRTSSEVFSNSVSAGVAQAFDMQNKSAVVNSLLFAADTGGSLEIRYSPINGDFAEAAFETLVLVAGEKALNAVDIPGWAAFAEIKHSVDAAVVVKIFRG